jgi:hypothetical protein
MRKQPLARQGGLLVPLKRLRLSALVVVLSGAAMVPATERLAMAWTYIIWYTPAAPTPPPANPPGRNPTYSVEGPVSHATPPPPPPAPRKYRVILRDGSAVVARDQPKLVGGTVRFIDDRGGTLVAIKATEVNLAATAAANQLSLEAASQARGPAAAAAPAPAKQAPAASGDSRASVKPPH